MEEEKELLIRIDENVKYLRESLDDHREAFDDHVAADENLKKDFILPLWNESQQRQGAWSVGNFIYTFCMALVAAAAGYWGGHP